MRRKFSEKKQWSHRLAKSRYPGVFIMEEGGCLVRARVRDPWKSKVKGVKWSGYTEIKRVFRAKTEEDASAWLSDERKRISSRTSATRQERLFAKFALSVLKEKAELRELGIEKQADWKNHLIHLIEGTTSEKDASLSVKGFGNLLVDEITYDLVTQWKVGISRLIFETEEYKPGTTNGWYSAHSAPLEHLFRTDSSSRSGGLEHCRSAATSVRRMGGVRRWRVSPIEGPCSGGWMGRRV